MSMYMISLGGWVSGGITYHFIRMCVNKMLTSPCGGVYLLSPKYHTMNNTRHIITGDCIEGMKTLPDGCVHTCVTSPPYFGLRDYGGGDSEIGQEDTVEWYVQKMVEVFREVRRILRNDGTVWLNLGEKKGGSDGFEYAQQHNLFC